MLTVGWRGNEIRQDQAIYFTYLAWSNHNMLALSVCSAVSGKEEIMSQMPVENAGLDNIMYFFTSSLFRTCIMLMAFLILQEEDIVCSIF